MDKADADRWLKEAKDAMDEQTPKIVAAFDNLARQHGEILKVGVRAMLRAALRDAAHDVMDKLLRDITRSAEDGGASPLAFSRGGLVGETAVGRFIH